MNLDIGEWRAFRIGDLFDVRKGTRLTKADMTDGNVRFVSAANTNNGITARIGNVGHIHPGGTLTVCYNGNGGTGKSFYQDRPFWASDDVNVLYPRFLVPHDLGGVEPTGLNERVGLFLAADIERVGRVKYGFTDKWALKYMLNDSVMLPVDATGRPDWAYMDAFMGRVSGNMQATFEAVCRMREPRLPVSTAGWARFRLADVFEVTKGRRLTKANRIDGSIPYVGASQVNNGITQLIGNTEHVVDGHCLTVCYNGPVGATFYQPRPFWPTDDVNVLRPRADVSMEALLFVAPIIEGIGRRNYAYIDKWKQEDMRETMLLLPADESGKPDWGYMETYMREALGDSAARLDAMTT